MSGVLHVITGLGVGGAETMLVQLAIALQGRGLPQHVVSLTDEGPLADRLKDHGITVAALGMRGGLTRTSGVARLCWLTRRVKPDVIQGWMYHGNIAACAAHMAAPGTPRLMWNIRASNMDAERYAQVIGWNARLSGRPDVVLVNSHASVDVHRDHGFTPRRVVVVHNGIDTKKYGPDRSQRDVVRDELGIDRDAVVATVVARVDPMKDHQCFLDALWELPHVTGLLVGAGTEELDLPPNAIAAGLRPDVERIHQAADLIVSCSAYGEGFSNALAEGMSSGLVPVATDVGDSGLIVGETGRVVPPGSPELLASAIEAEAAPGSAALRKRGRAARQRILDNFTLARAIATYETLYR